jgi:HSP20 family molecular chaperone IbpA
MANHKDGILTITVPKKEEAKEKQARDIKIS